VDHAQCYFKEQLFQFWEDTSFGDGEDGWTPEAEWCESVRGEDNPASIGLMMLKKLEKAHGFTIAIMYPGCEKVLEDVEKTVAGKDVPGDTGKCGCAQGGKPSDTYALCKYA
jgi:hypothetical protein